MRVSWFFILGFLWACPIETAAATVPVITQGGLDNFCRDLSLSDAQANYAEQAFGDYLTAIAQATEQYSSDLQSVREGFETSPAKWLDPNVQQVLGTPGPSQEDRIAYAQSKVSLRRKLRAAEDEARQLFLAGVQRILTDAQMSVLSHAVVRLSLNAHFGLAGTQLNNGIHVTEYIDLLPLVERALSACPGSDDAIDDEAPFGLDTTTQIGTELALVLRDFELAYEHVLGEYSAFRDAHGAELARLQFAADRTRLSELNDARRRIAQKRHDIVKTAARRVSDIVESNCGASCAFGWRDVFGAAQYPAIYQTESPEQLMAWIRELAEIPEDVLRGADQTLDRYQTSRRPLRERQSGILAKFGATAVLSTARTGELAVFDAIQRRRVQLADRTNDTLRRLLPAEYWVAFDSRLAQIRAAEPRHDLIVP